MLPSWWLKSYPTLFFLEDMSAVTVPDLHSPRWSNMEPNAEMSAFIDCVKAIQVRIASFKPSLIWSDHNLEPTFRSGRDNGRNLEDETHLDTMTPVAVSDCRREWSRCLLTQPYPSQSRYLGWSKIFGMIVLVLKRLNCYRFLPSELSISVTSAWCKTRLLIVAWD